MGKYGVQKKLECEKWWKVGDVHDLIEIKGLKTISKLKTNINENVSMATVLTMQKIRSFIPLFC